MEDVMEDAIMLLAMLAVAIVFYFLSLRLLRWFGRTLPMSKTSLKAATSSSNGKGQRDP
jgi:hypothetical protein